ncbi:MAG: 6-bladed beta-propeller [Acidobacteriota bacterium]|nr:6-bladed beta-propeller [Acidobacteriota bacterium]
MILFLSSCRSEPTPETKVIDGIHFKDIEVRLLYDVDTAESGPSWRLARRLAVGDQKIYLDSIGDPIFIFDTGGRFLGELGRLGPGPGEYSQARTGLLAKGSDVWVIDIDSVVHFRNDGFLNETRLPVSPDRALMLSGIANDTAMAAGNLLLPTKNADGRIGVLVNTDGEIVAGATDPGFDEYLMTMNKRAKNAQWQWHEGTWYCLYNYTPRLALYDRDLRPIGDLALSSPIIEQYRQNYFDESTTENQRSVALFWSFQIYKGKGYALTQGGLHGFDLETAQVDTIFRFKSKDLPESQGAPVAFHMFRILENDRIILATAWDDSQLFSASLTL